MKHPCGLKQNGSCFHLCPLQRARQCRYCMIRRLTLTQNSSVDGKPCTYVRVTRTFPYTFPSYHSVRILDLIIQVLKCIMVREGYLARVTRMAETMARRAKRHHGQLQALPPGMVDLLDLLRISTLDAVEAISLWRLSQVH